MKGDRDELGQNEDRGRQFGSRWLGSRPRQITRDVLGSHGMSLWTSSIIERRKYLLFLCAELCHESFEDDGGQGCFFQSNTNEIGQAGPQRNFSLLQDQLFRRREACEGSKIYCAEALKSLEGEFGLKIGSGAEVVLVSGGRVDEVDGLSTMISVMGMKDKAGIPRGM